jgi:hypothetical protein
LHHREVMDGFPPPSGEQIAPPAPAGFPVSPGLSERTDIFWVKAMWGGRSIAVWEDRSDLIARIELDPVTGEAKPGSVRAQRLAQQLEVAPVKMWRGERRSDYLRVLGALWMWRVMTGEQLAALLDADVRLVRRWCNTLFVAGAIERGNTLTRSGRPYGPDLYRISKLPELDAILADCTMAERLGVTGGKPSRSQGFADRHDLLGTELMLRALEFWPEAHQGTWLGECMLSLPAVCEVNQISMGSNADLGFIRSDGLRIAFEVIGSYRSTSAKTKIARWVHHIAASDGDVMVVWVDSSTGPDHQLPSVVAKVMDGIPLGKSRRRVSESIATLRWEHWFPAEHRVDPRFLSATVKMPLNDGGPIERWREVSLWDRPMRKAPAGWGDVLDVSHLLYGIPDHLRVPDLAPPLNRVLVEKSKSTDE